MGCVLIERGGGNVKRRWSWRKKGERRNRETLRRRRREEEVDSLSSVPNSTESTRTRLNRVDLTRLGLSLGF